jgi:hypothetical protein
LKQLFIILSLLATLYQTVAPNQIKQLESGFIEKPDKSEYSKEEKFRDRLYSTTPIIIDLEKVICFADLPSRLHTHPLISKPTPPPDPSHLL